MITPQDAWDTTYHQLQLQLDQAKFDTWVRDARFLRFDGDTFVVGVRNTFARDMLQHRLYRNVVRVLSDAWGKSATIRFELLPTGNGKAHAEDAELPLFQIMAEARMPALPTYAVAEAAPAPAPTYAERVPAPLPASLPEMELNARYTFDRFVVGPSNHLAYEAVQSVLDAPGRHYNPLFIYGGVGVGKTHLLQAAAHVSRAAGKRAIYVPSEAFTNDLVVALRTRTTPMMREKYRTADVLIVDDVQFLAGKDSTVEEFFHTFNVLRESGKQIILASDRAPADLATLEDRLRSRFSGGLVVDIGPMELELRMAIVKLWMHEQNIQLSDPVVQVIAESVASARELEGAFNMIAARVRLTATPIKRDDAVHILRRLEGPRVHNRALTLDEITQVVSSVFGVKVEEILGKGRTKAVSLARQAVMSLARDLTDLSLIQIGAGLGDRTHSTVISGIKKVAELCASAPEICEQLEVARKRLLGQR
ncbi:MAG: chromosomal replication initiator protein DnaA [Chloroflexi bacterium]|nr:chromosomal replication initiator protein DnaA [Chloroflexota bacterium]